MLGREAPDGPQPRHTTHKAININKMRRTNLFMNYDENTFLGKEKKHGVLKIRAG